MIVEVVANFRLVVEFLPSIEGSFVYHLLPADERENVKFTKKYYNNNNVLLHTCAMAIWYG